MPNNIYALGLKDWCFAHHVRLAADSIMDMGQDNVTIIPIWQDPDHGIVVEKDVSTLVEDGVDKDGDRKFKEVHRSRFEGKKLPLTVIIPYNLSGRHFEVAVITIDESRQVKNVNIYNHLDGDYEKLKSLVESQLEIKLPPSATKTYTAGDPRVIGCADGRCGDAVIAIMRLKSQGRLARYDKMQALYKIEPSLSKEEQFDELRKSHYLEGLIEKKKKVKQKIIIRRPKTASISDSEIDMDALSSQFSGLSHNTQNQYYDDSTDEETSENIAKAKTARTRHTDPKDLLLQSLHHESLKILYSKEVDEYYYGSEKSPGLKQNQLSAKPEKNPYDFLFNSIKRIILEEFKGFTDVDSMLETDEEYDIEDQDLQKIVNDLFSSDEDLGATSPMQPELEPFSKDFTPRLKEFIESLKKPGGYQELSKKKRETSSHSSAPKSPLRGRKSRTFQRDCDKLVTDLMNYLSLQIISLGKKGQLAEGFTEVMQEGILEKITKTIKDTPSRPTLADSFDAGLIKNGYEFIANLRLLNRSAKRLIRNLRDRSSKPLFKEKKVTHISGDFENTLSESKFLETQEITYSTKEKRYSRKDHADKLESYTGINSTIESIQKEIKGQYKVEITDSQIASNTRSCLKGEGIKLDDKISKEHQLQIEDFIINLAYLLFGTEAARNPSSLIVHNMMLDLLILGQESFKNLFDDGVKKVAMGGAMPMSKKGATATARHVNQEYNSLTGDGFDFKYQYLGEIKSSVTKTKETLTSTEITDAEYEMTKKWLKSRLGGDHFDEKKISEQFKQEIAFAKRCWFTSQEKEIISEVMQSSRIKALEKRLAQAESFTEEVSEEEASSPKPGSKPFKISSPQFIPEGSPSTQPFRPSSPQFSSRSPSPGGSDSDRSQ